MRYIYTDEAGTSANEPVSVVAAIVIHADREYLAAEQAVADVLTMVPEQYRPGFYFHAKSIWGDPKYRTEWSFQDHLAFIKAMMSIPHQLGMPVALGKVRRDAGSMPEMLKPHLKISNDQWHHLQAFMECMSMADQFVRDYGENGEIATVVAENVGKIQEHLRMTLNILRQGAYHTVGIEMRLTKSQKEWGLRPPARVVNVERIRDTVHFTAKEDAPLLQIADACAFGLRRFVSGQIYGQEFAESVAGKAMHYDDWTGPMSAAILYRPKCLVTSTRVEATPPYREE